jgi:filamentous hemagglutinin family protein
VNISGYFKEHRYLCIILGAIVSANVNAEVTLDGSLGSAVSLTGPNYMIGEDLGQISGSNLFHSFGAFNLTNTESATFTGPGSISNILGRVTGGSASNIDGTINSQIPGANLYLINPNGIIFGPNATLNVTGSFHATTADYIRLGDSGRFDAANPGNSALVSAPPSAFGFLNQPGAINVDQSVLKVPKGKTLSLVAGNVTITGAPRVKQGSVIHPGEPGFNCGTSCLRAPGGRIQIAGVTANNEVPTDLSAANASSFGADVTIENHSLVDVSDETAGAVIIRAGTFTTNTSEFRADSSGDVNATAVAVDVATSATAEFRDTVVGARSDGTAKSGAIKIDADIIELLDGTRLETGSCSSCDGGAGGKIVLNASNRITLQGVGHDGEGVKVTNNTKSVKNAGDITLIAGMELQADGATVSSITESSGNAGSLTLEAKQIKIENKTLLISDTGAGRGGPGSGGGGTGGGGTGGGGTGGGGTGQIDGNGGDLFIRAEERITLQQEANVGTNSNSSGNAGNVLLEAPIIEILDGSRLGSNVDASGNSGSITIVATDSLILDGTNGKQDPDRNRGSRITVGSRSTATGDAGSINITATNIIVDDGGRITSSTSGIGEGGSINILADGSVTLRGSRLDGDGSSIQAASEVEENEAGDSNVPRNANAGEIFIQTSSLSLEPGTEIRTNTSLPGLGGRIIIQSGQLNLSGATIQSTSTGDGSGDAGDINITASQNLEMINSSIATSASQADGGNIKLTVSDTVYLLNSDITARVQGGGGSGGNINIDPIFVVLDGSDITADAVGGNGGNIQIISDFFITTPDSSVTASSALGIDGTVDVQAPDEEITGALTALPATFLDASALLRSRCGARIVKHASSFIVSGPGALPIRPEDPQPVFYGESLDQSQTKASKRSRASSQIGYAPVSHRLLMSYSNCSEHP